MVTVAEARAQIQKRKGQIERSKLPTRTPTQLRQLTRGAVGQRQLQERQLLSSKQLELERLSPVEKQVVSAEKEIKAAENLQRDIKAAKGAADRGIIPFGAPKRIQDLTKFFQQEQDVFKQNTKIKQEFQRLGLTPVFSKGTLRGFESSTVQKSFRLEDLPSVQPGAVDPLEQVGILQVTRGRDLGTPFISTVQIAPTTREQLSREIKKATPELKFLGTSVEASLIKNIIGGVQGTTRFGKEKLIGKLTKAKDIEGKRIFTPAQARKTVELSVEVAENILIGKGVGKAVGVGRGVFAGVIPKTLGKAPKFQRVSKLLQIGATAGLGVVEARNVVKIFQEQGEDAAILRLIGDVAFVSGFSSTGFKTSEGARKATKKAVKNLKKTAPKISDKRGELLRKKKKKKQRLTDQEQVSLDDFEEAQEVVGSLEKALVKEKTLEGQLKVLSKISNKLTDKNSIEGFRKVVSELQKRKVFKPQVVEFKPGITVRGIKPKPSIKFVASSPAKVRNEKRVERAQEKNEKTIAKSKLTLGEKFKAAQKTVVATGLGSKALQALRSQQQQKTFQSLKSRQTLKQKTLQKQRQESRQKLVSLLRPGLSTKQKLRLRQKLRSRLRNRTRPRLRIPLIPFFIPKLGGPGKKKLKKKPFKPGDDVFELFVRKKGKDLFVKAFKDPKKARKALRKRLSTTLRASGFIVDKSTSQKLKPKPLRGFRISKIRKDVLVERRSRRLDTGLERASIKEAKRAKKAFKPDKNSMSKKLKRRKKK